MNREERKTCAACADSRTLRSKTIGEGGGGLTGSFAA